MPRSRPALNYVWCALALMLPGCFTQTRGNDGARDLLTHYQDVATQIETPAVCAPSDPSMANVPSPRSILSPAPVEYWDLGLQEAIQYGLSHSRVMIDLGATVLHSPDTVATTYTPAVAETDPQFGPEAALSAFDANLAMSLYFQKNDQQVNNRLVGVNGYYNQDYDVFETDITKRSAIGSQFTFSTTIDYNRDNYPSNLFAGGNWDAIVQGEVRQPLLQGSGLDFNRIAGPGAQPGVYNGVLVARIKTDIGLNDFAMGVRDYVSNVENAYWDLYYSYRDLDAKIKARDEALETWRAINALHQTNRRGGEADKEAQAREQYFQFEAEVQNALVGRELEATQTNNGSTPGTFRGLPGVQVAERRLRLVMGLPPTDGRMIRPGDEPPVSRVTFDWSQLVCQALSEREELRRQRWVVKTRELALVASGNFLKPTLDMVGRYRVRGFGADLLNPGAGNVPEFNNAFGNLASGQFAEWEMGAEFSMPFGFREGHTAVRSAELQVTQARAILYEQERQVLSDLSGAVAEVDRAFALLQTNINRSVAARDQLRSLRVAYDADKVELFVVLDAQRRYAEALSEYYASRVEYAIALRNVYYEKGSLLDYCDVSLAEGPWADKAYHDATTRERLRGKPRQIDYAMRQPPVVSRGPEVHDVQPGTAIAIPAEAAPAEAVPAGPKLYGPAPSGPTIEPGVTRLPGSAAPPGSTGRDKPVLPQPPSAPADMRTEKGPPLLAPQAAAPEQPVKSAEYESPTSVTDKAQEFFLRDEE